MFLYSGVFGSVDSNCSSPRDSPDSDSRSIADFIFCNGYLISGRYDSLLLFNPYENPDYVVSSHSSSAENEYIFVSWLRPGVISNSVYTFFRSGTWRTISHCIQCRSGFIGTPGKSSASTCRSFTGRIRDDAKIESL